MKKFLWFFAFLFGIASASFAHEVRVEGNSVYLKNYSLAELKEEFKKLAYDEFLNPANNSYPPVYVENIPSDFDSEENKTIRNQLFMQIVLPHVLKINDELKAKRKHLLEIRDRFKRDLDINAEDSAFLEALAKEYEYVTPFKDSRRSSRILNEMLERVDAVPPSILVGAAAIYTKWGTSRIAREGNNLYKERNWYSEEGLKPEGEDSNEPYRYKVYPSIEDSIREYVFKINTSPNFVQFRSARRISHKRGDILYGKRLVWSFVLDNNMKNFAGVLDYTITFYRMTFF